MQYSGAELLVRILEDAGIKHIAGIPGHTVASLADAAGRSDRLLPLLVRHEAIATFAADVYYRITGKLMATFFHGFPGLLNGLVGVGNAYADSSALLAITGQTARPAIGRGGYQEFSRQTDADTPELLRHTVKRVWRPFDAVDLIDKTHFALRAATTGRPGPVGLDVFQDIWDEGVELNSLPDSGIHVFSALTRPSADVVAQAMTMLRAAERPVIVAGSGAVASAPELLKFAERNQIPVATTIVGKDCIPHSHPLSLGVVGWVGTRPANWACSHADTVLVVGARLSETTASSWQPGISFDPSVNRFIQIDVDPMAIGNAYPVEVPIVADSGETLKDLLEFETIAPKNTWLSELASLRVEWDRVVADSQSLGKVGHIGVGSVVAALNSVRDEKPLNVVCDIGKHHKWLVQQFDNREGDRTISSMAGGAMGFGPCGSIGSALASPDRRTVCWTGDGGMSMWIPSWLTASEYELPISFIVINDQSYGAVANIQKRQYGTTFFSEFDAGGRRPPQVFDAASIAAACGIQSRKVEDPSEVDDAVRWSLRNEGPSVVDFACAQDSVAPSGGGIYLHDLWNHRTLPVGAR